MIAGRQRWFLLVVIGAVLAGCGDDSKKSESGATGGGGGGQVAGPPAGIAPPGLASGDAGSAARGGAATPTPAPSTPAPAPAVAAPPSGNSQAGLQDLLQYIPENLRIVAGANFNALADKSHAIGPRVFMQLQPALSVLAAAGLKREQLDGLWVGHNPETGDLAICARSKGGYDAGGVTKALGAIAPGEKIGKAQVYALPEASQKNAVACVDSRTLLIGRYDTVAAALKSPAVGPARNGLKALNTPDVHYWVAGDDAYAHQWFTEPEIELLETLFSERVKTLGVAIGFGGTAAPSASAPPQIMMRRNAAPEDEERQDNFQAMRGAFGGRGAAAAAAAAGAEPPPKGLDIAIGLCFATDGVASTVENRINALKAGPAAQEGARAQAQGGGRRGGEEGDEEQQDNFQALRAGGGRRGRGGRAGGGGAGAGPGGGGVQGPILARAAPIQVNAAREKENLRLTMSVPINGPFVATFINDEIRAAAPAARADGLSPGTLTILAASIPQWQAKPGVLRGARRVENLRPLAGYGFLTELLPFVGYADLYTSFDFSRSWADRDNRPHAMMAIPAFLNASDPRMHWSGFPLEKTGLGLTHFVGMSGIEDRPNVIAAALPRSDPRAGIFGYDEVVRSGDIPDGAAQTIMMIGAGRVVAPWVQGGGATIRGARAPYFDEVRGFGSMGLAAPGAYVLMADGSVRVMRADIDPEVFKALCTVRGAETIDMSKLVTQGQD